MKNQLYLDSKNLPGSILPSKMEPLDANIDTSLIQVKDKAMRIVVNGFDEKIPSGTSLDELIDMFEHRDHSLIVEINHQFISPADYSNKTLSEGDVIELILPAFGG